MKQTRCQPVRVLVAINVAIAAITLSPTSARAQFTTIINVPPNIGDHQSIGSGTQLNMTSGSIGISFDAGEFAGTSENIEVNISGGVVGENWSAHAGSVFNVSGGSLGHRGYVHGGVVNLLSGAIGSILEISPGSIVNVTGGFLGSPYILGSSQYSYVRGTLNLSGGVVGDRVRFGFDDVNEVVTISGSDFRINGVAVAGLETPGSTVSFVQSTLPGQSWQLAGTLSDGTPFVFASGNADFDHFPGTIVLHSTAIPAVGQSTINVPGSVAPLGIRDGQTLVLENGGIVGDHFQAGRGSAVEIYGGNMGHNFEAVGTNVTISDGTVGHGFDAFMGTTVNMSGGTIGDSFIAHDGSNVNITGGAIGNFFEVALGSVVDVSGGVMGDHIRAWTESQLDLRGGEFRLNGDLIAGLDVPGNMLNISIPLGSLFTGVLEDGTPFTILSGANSGTGPPPEDLASGGTFTLHSVALPAVGPSIIHAPTDPAPTGLRSGQTLVLNEGGHAGNHFQVSYGSAVEITGGVVGADMEVVGANVKIFSGSVGPDFDAFRGGLIEIRGGSIGDTFEAHEGSIVEVTDGSFGAGFHAYPGSMVRIRGGSFGDFFRDEAGSVIHLSTGVIGNRASFRGLTTVTGGLIGDHGSQGSNEAVLTIADGSVGNSFVARAGTVHLVAGMIGNAFHNIGATVNISGGAFGDSMDAQTGSTSNFSGGSVGTDFDADSSSTVNIFGTQFTVGGNDITGMLTDDVMFTVADRNVTLTGILADGTPFDFVLNSTNFANTDYFNTGATLTITLVSGIPGDFNDDGVVNAADYTVWRNNMGASVAVRGKAGDGNYDGQVTPADYYVWKKHYGNSIGELGGSFDERFPVNVPEPAGFLLGVMALGSIFLKNRKRIPH